MGWDRGYSLLLFSTVRCNGAPCLCLDCTATLLNPPSQKVFERQQRRRTTDGRASPSAHRPFVEDSEESYVGSGVVHLVATSEVRQKHAGIFTATLHFWWHKGHEMRHDAMKAQTETERGQARRNEQQIYHRTGVFFCRTSLVIRFSNQARQREGTKQNQARQRCLDALPGTALRPRRVEGYAHSLHKTSKQQNHHPSMSILLGFIQGPRKPKLPRILIFCPIAVGDDSATRMRASPSPNAGL